MEHWTKTKGDSGVGFIIADLMSQGIHIALPISEHLPFDCIAISPQTSKLVRISCKYRKIYRGKMDVAFKSVWNDKHGTHIKHQDLNTFDCTAIYCPETKEVYYLMNKECTTKSFSLRLEYPKNGQKAKIRLAKDYRNPNRIFEP